MTKRLSIASAVFTVLSALLALMLIASPVFADEGRGDDKGQERSAEARDRDESGEKDDADESETTEKNDGDDDDATDPNADDDDNAHPSGKDRSVENGGSGNQGNSDSDPDDDGRGPDRSNGGADKPGGSGGVDASDQDGNNGCGNDDDFEDDNEGWCGKPEDVEGGNATAGMTIEVDCYSVTVTATKDISNVKVYFVDGTMEEINVNAPTFSQTFDKPISHATSKSALTEVADTAECDEVEGGTIPCPSGMTSPTGTCDTPEIPPGTVLGDPIEDDVLGEFIVNGDADSEADTVAAGGVEAPATRPASQPAALPFTGLNIVLVLVVALGLLGVGVALFRTRRN